MPNRSTAAGRVPRKMKMVDVARLAGVSTATISRVLNGSPLVDPTTAARVHAIILETNYVPNNTGTALKSGRSGIFGLIIPDISNPFFADFVKYFEREAVDHDQEMLIAITDHSAEQMQRCIRRMLMRGVEGLVILESEIETRSYETMLHNQVPLVTLNRLTLEHGVSDVAIDATSGMTAAVEYLAGLGHRHIGFLGGRAGQTIAVARESSFRSAMKANRLDIDETAILYADFKLEGGTREMKRLLDTSPGVTAVLCANDLSAIGALRTLDERGLRSGTDLSIIGLDDIDLCTMVHPPLTTLRISRPELVNLYFQALTGLLANPHQPGVQLFQALELIIRGTTGPPPSSRTAASGSPASGSQGGSL